LYALPAPVVHRGCFVQTSPPRWLEAKAASPEGKNVSMTDLTSNADHLAGYRVVRKLGEGARAEVYLGVADTPDPSERAVAIKVFRSSVPESDVFHELEVLDRVPEQHCVRLIDVSTAPTGLPLAILPRVARGSLGRVMHRRGFLEPGEIVTTLAPIAGSVAALHERGITHTAISTSTIHFAEDGSPCLLGFGHASLFEAGASVAALEARDDTRLDRQALAQVTRLLVDAGPQWPARPALLRWLDRTDLVSSASFPRELEDRLFEFAVASPVDLDKDSHAQSSADEAERRSPPQRIVVRGYGEPAPAHQHEGPAIRGRSRGNRRKAGSSARRRTSTRLRESDQPPEPHRSDRHAMVELLLGAAPLAPLKARAADAVRSVRRRWWITMGVIAAALVAALVLLPTNTSESASLHGGAESTGDMGEVVGRAELSSSSNIAAVPDAPAEALPLLLAERASCLALHSLACLDAVDHAGSTLAADDAARIAGTASEQNVESGSGPKRGSEPGAEAEPEPGLHPGSSRGSKPDAEGEKVDVAGTAISQITHSGTIGAFAIVDFRLNDEPASALMIRTEAGWRLRVLFGAASP
jgi:hypothetical protein